MVILYAFIISAGAVLIGVFFAAIVASSRRNDLDVIKLTKKSFGQSLLWNSLIGLVLGMLKSDLFFTYYLISGFALITFICICLNYKRFEILKGEG